MYACEHIQPPKTHLNFIIIVNLTLKYTLDDKRCLYFEYPVPTYVATTFSDEFSIKPC